MRSVHTKAKNKLVGGVSNTLLSLAFTVAMGAWLAYDYLPADAGELASLVAQAQGTPRTKATVEAALKLEPTPNRLQLRKLKESVNEALMLDIAKKATNDTSLLSKEDREARDEDERMKRLDALEAKPITRMTADERGEYLVAKAPPIMVFLMLVGAIWFGFRKVMHPEAH
jgi:hypothetical protein